MIITDSESMTGIAPVCDVAHDAFDVRDCCPFPQIEVYDEGTAETLALVLTSADARLA